MVQAQEHTTAMITRNYCISKARKAYVNQLSTGNELYGVRAESRETPTQYSGRTITLVLVKIKYSNARIAVYSRDQDL